MSLTATAISVFTWHVDFRNTRTIVVCPFVFGYMCIYLKVILDSIQNNQKVLIHFSVMGINLNDHGWHVFPAFHRGNVISFVPLYWFIMQHSQTQSYPYIFDRHFQMTWSFIHELGQLWWTDH